MLKQKQDTESRFTLEGRFVGFVGNFGKKPKRIRVATAAGAHDIKLAKELRCSLSGVLEPGNWLQIAGKQKYKKKTGKLKLKADQINSITPVQPKSVSPSPMDAPKTKACVMVCQKSSCRKRGGSQVSQSVANYLQERGWQNEVGIKGTGCMKQCKQGPCVVFMPDKSRYINVHPKQVPILMEKHLVNNCC